MNQTPQRRLSLDTWRENRENISEPKSQVLPRFGEFQLLGDSLLVEFADKILQQHNQVKHGTRTIGLCISGQRIDQLHQRVKVKTYPLSSKVMVLIGTGDVLYGANIRSMKKHFNALLIRLKKSVDQILILTLPPIPKLCVTYYHWTLIRQYNAFLKSKDNGTNVTVADICPLFTKFRGALEYEINNSSELSKVPFHYFKRQKSLLKHRRKCWSEQKKKEGKYGILSDKSESDYRNTTDTNTSVDSEVLSSEHSQDRENYHNTFSEDYHVVSADSAKQSQTKSPERFQNPIRFVVRTFQSVFGKDIMNRKKIPLKEEEFRLNSINTPEKRARKSPLDLNECLDCTDIWNVESDEDCMTEHIYRSQEEIKCDVVDMNSHYIKKINGEFSKFLESMNENGETTKKGLCLRRSKSGNTRNERPEMSESSSSSDSDTPKKQISPFIDDCFREYVENSLHNVGEINGSKDSVKSSSYSPGTFICRRKTSKNLTASDSTFSRNKEYIKFYKESRGFKNVDGLCERDKLILQLANKICHLECYELFYSSPKKRIDMVHLNYYGLCDIKNFLIFNNYVSL